MKKLHFPLFLGWLFIHGCQNTLPSIEKESVSVCFSIQPDTNLYPFPDSKSIPDTNVPEPEVHTSGQEVTPDFEFIEYAVYDLETKVRLRHKQFKRDDKTIDDFGVYVYDQFKEGSYQVCFATHSVPNMVPIEDQFQFPYVSDMFYGSQDIIISGNASSEPIEISLHRIVSRVDFKATEAVPDEIHSFQIAVSGIYPVFNLLTGKVNDQTKEVVFPHTFTEAERRPSVRNTHAFYTLVPDSPDNKVKKVILSALDDSDEPVRSRILTHIPISANRITQYKGLLYTPGMTEGSFELNFSSGGEWEGTDEHEFPE